MDVDKLLKDEKFLDLLAERLLSNEKFKDKLLQKLNLAVGRRSMIAGAFGALLGSISPASAKVVIGGESVVVDGHKLMTWDEIKAMLELEGALNKVYDADLDGKIDAEVTGYCSKYDTDNDGVIEKIAAEVVSSLPAPGKRGRLVVYNSKLYYDNGSEWI